MIGISKIKNYKRGFTLIEVFTAVTIFSLLISIFAEIFLSATQTQQRVLGSQQSTDNLSYTLEYMGRALRMAKKDHAGSCLTSSDPHYNYETNSTKDRIRFLNYQNICQEFFLDSATGQLMEDKSTNQSAINFSGDPLPLTSVNMNVLSFRVGVTSSWGQLEEVQPRVVLVLEVEDGADTIYLQTMVSQRNLNVIY